MPNGFGVNYSRLVIRQITSGSCSSLCNPPSGASRTNSDLGCLPRRRDAAVYGRMRLVSTIPAPLPGYRNTHRRMDDAVTISNLRKVYGTGVVALDGIDLTVKQGDFFALLGPNGAGKTTAIGILTSLIRPTSGSVSVFGYDLDRNREVVKTHIGVVPQEVNLNMFERNFNTLVNQAGYYGVPRRLAKLRAEKYLKALHLWDRRDDIARTLSGGMKRRLMIARALVHEPKLLILDEPTAGVDIEIRRSMWEMFREVNASGVTIILTTHYLEEAESLCRDVAIIDQGRIIEHDSIANVLRKLQVEVFVLTLRADLRQAPVLAPFSARLRTPTELEIEVERGQCLNDVFAELSRQSIEVESMRTKSNRLEELFMRLVKDSKKKEANN
jgi:ABC-2 type transport system ATP-binding protein